MEYPPELLARIEALCEADPHREVCGLVVRRSSGTLEVEPIANVAPARRAAYFMDPGEQLRVNLQLRREGGNVVAVYHSHPAGDAHFSARDRADAVCDGAPLLPGVEYLVFGLESGRVEEARRYCWDGTGFAEKELPRADP